MVDELAENHISDLHGQAQGSQKEKGIELGVAIVAAIEGQTEAAARLQESVEKLAQQHARLVKLLSTFSAEQGTDELAVWFRKRQRPTNTS